MTLLLYGRTTSTSEAPAINLSTAIHALLVEHRDKPILDKTVNDPYESYVYLQDWPYLDRGAVVGVCVLWSVAEPS